MAHQKFDIWRLKTACGDSIAGLQFISEPGLQKFQDFGVHPLKAPNEWRRLVLIRPYVTILAGGGWCQLAAVYTLPRTPDILAAAARAPQRGVTGTAYFTLHETRERIQQAHHWSCHGVPPPGCRCKRAHRGQLCWPYLTVVIA
jgi:hypothetical protein